MSKRFVHLHTHSHYSLLDGMSKIDEMVCLAAKDNMPALALTDHGALYGAIEFYKACKREGVKPIIGVEAYVASGSRLDKRPEVDKKRYHLTLLAKNNTGYKNLLKLTSSAHLEGFYYKPRVDKELLRKHSEGIICLSGCLASELNRALQNKHHEKAEQIIHEYQEIFGKENYFIEVMSHPGVEGYNSVRAHLIEIAKKHGIPLVGTQDSHYLHPQDTKAHETLLAVQQNTDLDDAGRLSLSGDDFSFIDTKTAYERFKDIPEAVLNTGLIADQCDINLKLGNWMFPNFEIPAGNTHDGELRKLTYKGIPFRNLKNNKAVEERIEYELGIIQKKGFSPYFLVVADLLRFARENAILTNTRGSAAGSLVSYLLGITNIDPLKCKLPFERFLNPERPSAPDIDMDFADNRRDEVIAYAREKYGENHVAQIGTFGTMMARGAVRDVARALGRPYADGDKIARLIPPGAQGFPMTIERAMELTPELSELYKNDEGTREILDLAKRLEGTVRHVSVHAAGVVIAPSALHEWAPIQNDPRGDRIITQYDMHAVEYVGLLKFDFLGIRNLTILGNAVELVKEYHQKEIDLGNLPQNDEKTFSMLARGETMGLFQLNGDGMTRYLTELEPTSVEDINAMIALYRPGPIAFIPEYINRKKNPELVTYLDDRMKEILNQSYGIITYQDDILLIAIKFAGYSWGEVDKFRKAVGKKIPKEMQAQKERFFEGCIKNGLSKEKTQELWNQIETFAAYGFNKAHAASYGQVAYQTSYMKANFPTEYMAAVLTAEAGDVDKIAETIAECARMKIPVLPPSINESAGNFTIIKGIKSARSAPGGLSPASRQAGSKSPTKNTKENRKTQEDQIRFGLYSIKNLGREIADAVITERIKGGNFVSLSDFLERIQHRNLNRRSLEALIKCGAMDYLGERGKMLANIDDALTYNKSAVEQASQQNSLFGLMKNQDSLPEFRLKVSGSASQAEMLQWEKELLGLYISGHPLEEHRDRLERIGTAISRVKRFREGVTAIIGGIVSDTKTIMTSSGERMAFIKLSDLTDSIETVVFPRVFNTYKELLQNNKSVIIRGKMSYRNGRQSIIMEKVKEL